MDRSTRGTVLVVVGVALIVGTLSVGAATAPDIGTQRVDSPQTLVGSQGADSYHAGGSVFLPPKVTTGRGPKRARTATST